MYRELSFRIPQGYDGSTIEKFLKDYAGFTKKQISQAKFRPGGFSVNGQQRRCTYVLSEQDVLTVCLEEEEKGSVHLADTTGKLQILYEDPDILVVNKPAGMVCHPSKGHFSETLANQAVSYYRQQRQEVTVRPIGRLDKDVSGTVVFAKNQMAAARLGKQRENGQFYKEYLALVSGAVEEELVITQPIGPWKSVENAAADRSNGSASGSSSGEYPTAYKMQVCQEGKPACTRVTPVEIRQEETLVKCVIHTGRTHQIRVHLSSVGHPIVGDVLYGGRPRKEEGICLHAWRVHFIQPFTGKILVAESLPVYISACKPGQRDVPFL